jgi:hypothetical protein
MTRVVTVIHSIHNSEQAREVYTTIEGLMVEQRDHCRALDIIVISMPQYLRRLSEDEFAVMDDLHTLSVSGAGSVIYSRNPPPLPTFNQVGHDYYTPQLRLNLIMLEPFSSYVGRNI